MNVTNSAGAVMRTPTIQPEEWQPGESRDLPEAEARALATSSTFTLADAAATQPTPAQPAQAAPIEAPPTPVESAPLGQPQPEPTPAPADPSPVASAEAPAQPAL
jgi:hypothetical protein